MYKILFQFLKQTLLVNDPVKIIVINHNGQNTKFFLGHPVEPLLLYSPAPTPTAAPLF